ncbi:MAG: DUF3189 family protein [Desulfotomaculaceae bacterium]|nr:DUF3189 family protein [Desulfotomaculaceae bacterium]
MAGAIHTGLLPAENVPHRGELWKLPFLNLKKSFDGEIISLGEDGQGNKVYALSVKGDCEMVYRLIASFLEISNLPSNSLHLVDNCGRDNILLLTGSILCRSALLAPMGRLLAMAGIKKSYRLISQIVSRQKTSMNYNDQLIH